MGYSDVGVSVSAQPYDASYDPRADSTFIWNHGGAGELEEDSR